MAKIDFNGIKGKIKNAADSVKDKVSEQKSKFEKTKELPEKVTPPAAISTRNAMKIMYYLIAADGVVKPEEEEKFDYIGAEASPEYESFRDAIIEECKKQLEKVIDDEDLFDVLRDGVENELLTSVQTEDTYITPKLLIWNMISVAYSDGEYSDIERRLIKAVVRRLEIDKAVLSEMENSFSALIDLEKELEWIKTTDRPYLTVETMVNEISDRKNAIYENVKDLISL